MSYGEYKVFSDNFQGGIAQKLRKGEQSLLCGTHCLNLMYISMKYHEDILKIVYGGTYSATPQYDPFFQNERIKIDDWDVKKLKQTKILKRKNI